MQLTLILMIIFTNWFDLIQINVVQFSIYPIYPTSNYNNSKSNIVG